MICPICGREVIALIKSVPGETPYSMCEVCYQDLEDALVLIKSDEELVEKIHEALLKKEKIKVSRFEMLDFDD